MTRARPPAALLALAVSLAPAVARAQATDSLVAAVARGAGFENFDRIAREHYLRRHAFSLDHFLEFEPGGFLVRLGPIGNEASYSRWGIGRGRALLRMNGIVLNDPQDDSPPLVHTPTSGLGSLSLAGDAGVPRIEGVVDIAESPSPSGRPNTYLELSKGTNDVRQRRVRFSSEASKVGIDLAYDEVLDDGYAFDASGDVPYTVDYGSARSRQSTIVLRGDPDASANFELGVRGFTSTTQGDLTSNIAEGRKSGHLVWVDAGVEETRLTLYARGYKSTAADSSAKNEAVGALASWRHSGPASSTLALRANVEGTDAFQDVGATADDHLVRASVDVDASRAVGERGTLSAAVTVAGDEETPFAWSARARARREGSRAALGVSLARSFRLPNFGERYLPAHTNAGRTLAGSGDVDPETAWEVAGDWGLRLGGSAVNRVRASWIQAEDAIAFRPRAVGTETWHVASNASDASSMWFVEERVTGDWKASAFRIRADAAVLYTSGDRTEGFASVPRFQTHAAFMLGRDFFEATSALFVGARFMSADSRVDYDGNRLPSFQVWNIEVEGRLLDARLYVQYLNVTDEQYRTQSDYLMTPGSLVYGIEWTMFD
ncbi:MAG TPA: TonB-dependent receptor [Candidatus Krumholzibacteria bacterium]|nr:TonB-dependent receptor [Candidatus Krumholzibacteria bacterium]